MKIGEASKESELHGRMRFSRYSFKRGLCVCTYTNAQEKWKNENAEKERRKQKENLRDGYRIADGRTL